MVSVANKLMIRHSRSQLPGPSGGLCSDLWLVKTEVRCEQVRSPPPASSTLKGGCAGQRKVAAR